VLLLGSKFLRTPFPYRQQLATIVLLGIGINPNWSKERDCAVDVSKFSSQTPWSRVHAESQESFSKTINSLGVRKCSNLWDFRFWRCWTFRLLSSDIWHRNLVYILTKIPEESATVLFFCLENWDSRFSETFLPIYHTTRYMASHSRRNNLNTRCSLTMLEEPLSWFAFWARSPQLTSSFRTSSRCTNILWRVWGLCPFSSHLSYTGVLCPGSSDTNLSRFRVSVTRN
jgi:hypothetical protein